MKNIRIIPMIFLFSLIFANSYTQEWNWIGNVNCDNKSQTNGMDIDSDGNAVMLMVYQGTITIEGRDITSAGNKDLCLVKYDIDGDTLWARTAGSTNKEVPRDMHIDQSDNIYITGSFKGTCNFGSEVIVNTYGSEDIFLAKYDKDGNVLWAKNIAEGPDIDRSSSITVDDDGNIQLVGFYNDSVFFDNDTLLSNGHTNNFLAKFDSDGNFISARNFIGTDDADRLNAVSLSNDNALLISGFFNDTLFVDSETLITQGGSDLILIKVGIDGTTEWIRTGGGPGADIAYSAASDDYGNVYFTGSISDGALLDSTGLGNYDASPISSNGLTDIFLIKFNKNGTLIWKVTDGDTGEDEGHGVQVNENLVQFTGYFTDTLTLGTDTIVSRNSSMDVGVFVYDTRGYKIKAMDINGSAEDRGQEVINTTSGQTYIAGYYDSDTLLFDGNILIRSSGTRNSFIANFYTPFSASITDVGQIECNGDNTGSLTVTPYFGVGPYEYTWSHDGLLNDSVATGLGAGSYFVTITDSRDSSAVTNHLLSQPETIAIDLDSTDLTCYHSADGAIETTVTGGTAPYTYIWDGASGYDPTSEDQSGLDAGWFYVTVTDDNGCEKTDLIEVGEPEKITSTAIVEPESPAGSLTGAIRLSVSGGTSPFVFSWESSGGVVPGETGDTLKDIAEGSYDVYVSDDNLCEYDTTIIVKGEALQVLFSGTDITCNGLVNGSAVAIVAAGDKGEAYTYEFADSDGTSISPTGNDSTITNLAQGRYYVTITETAGDLRSAIDSVDIDEPEALVLTLTPTNVKCYGDSTGIVALDVEGGSPLYSYVWSNDSTSPNIVDLGVGTYDVTVTDENMCTETASAEITQPAKLTVDIALLAGLDCNGDADAIAQANVEGGTSPYNYWWNGGSTITEAIDRDLEAGSFIVKVTDGNNCIQYDTIKIDEPDLLSFLSVDTNNITCRNAADGSISVSMTGGTEPYSYSWSQGDFGDVNQIEGLYPIEYALTVTDNNGCDNSDFSFTPKQAATALSISEVEESHVDLDCYGDDSGILEITASGGWGSYEFSIDQENWSELGTFGGLTGGDFTLSVKDSGGCVAEDELTITEPDNSISISVGVIGESLFANASGGTPPYSYSIDGTTWQSGFTFSGLATGVYTVYVTDANSCGPATSEAVNIGTSIDDNTIGSLNVYPNPSSDIFYIELTENLGSDVDIVLYDFAGSKISFNYQILEKSGSTMLSIDLSGNEAGLYFLQINGITLQTKLALN